MNVTAFAHSAYAEGYTIEVGIWNVTTSVGKMDSRLSKKNIIGNDLGQDNDQVVKSKLFIN